MNIRIFSSIDPPAIRFATLQVGLRGYLAITWMVEDADTKKLMDAYEKGEWLPFV